MDPQRRPSRSCTIIVFLRLLLRLFDAPKHILVKFSCTLLNFTSGVLRVVDFSILHNVLERLLGDSK
jgi:hypothetical protein